MNFKLKSFEELSTLELYAILKLRSQVFVVEQTCAYNDIDDLDQVSWHLFVFFKEDLAAYCRILPPGSVYEYPAIGRVVVQPNFRKQKIGKDLMLEAIQKTFELFKCQQIIISAQMYLLKFYTSLGFTMLGDSYLEDGIPHIKMTFKSLN